MIIPDVHLTAFLTNINVFLSLQFADARAPTDEIGR